MSSHDEAVKDIKKAVEILDANPIAVSTENHPDAKKHKYISFAKSALRIVAFGFLAYYEIQTAAILLLVAELLGIGEELV